MSSARSLNDDKKLMLTHKCWVAEAEAAKDLLQEIKGSKKEASGKVAGGKKQALKVEEKPPSVWRESNPMFEDLDSEPEVNTTVSSGQKDLHWSEEIAPVCRLQRACILSDGKIK